MGGGGECTDDMSKEKYVCTIFAVLISLYVNSRPRGYIVYVRVHDHSSAKTREPRNFITKTIN